MFTRIVSLLTPGNEKRRFWSSKKPSLLNADEDGGCAKENEKSSLQQKKSFL